MITVFCDFALFRREKLAFFLNNHCCDQLFAKTSTTFEHSLCIKTTIPPF
jgi:hypothetical protein